MTATIGVAVALEHKQYPTFLHSKNYYDVVFSQKLYYNNELSYALQL